MAIQPFYETGTAAVTAGSAVVTGTGTAWTIGVVSGGDFSRAGLSIPIRSVDSNTQLTLAYPWPGTTGSGAYAIALGRAEVASAVTANARLADLVAELKGASPFIKTLLDDTNAAMARGTLELGTAATYAIGTSGATVPLLNAANTFGGTQIFANATVTTLLGVGAFSTTGATGGMTFSTTGRTNVSLQGTAGGTFTAFYTSNGVVGAINTNGTNAIFATSSDYRIKSEITDLEDAGAFIDALRPRRFRVHGQMTTGFIAHEFQEVSPISVIGEKDAVDEFGEPMLQSMQASSAEVMAHIVAELQALRRRVAELEAGQGAPDA